MTEHTSGYAVFLFEQAWEALGDPIKPYMQTGPSGPHITCHEVDTSGAFIEMTLRTTPDKGDSNEVELMVPSGMVRMIVSTHSDAAFGFAARDREWRGDALPVVGPDAPPPEAPTTSMPHGQAGDAAPTMDDRLRPPEG